MKTILGLSGSLRKKSYNSGLLRAAVELAPDGVRIETGSIREVPLYDGDREAEEGLPEPVLKLQEQLKAADGLLLVTPEYNNGVPGVFKNAIDWMSRGDGLEIFAGKPVAVTGASDGGFGTILSQAHWLPVLRTLKTRHWQEGRMRVSRAPELFDEDGNLTDERQRRILRRFIERFAESL